MSVSETSAANLFTFGISAMFLATLALVIASVGLAVETYKPQKPIEQTIGETAAKIKDAAKKAITGQTSAEPKENNPPFDIRFFAHVMAIILSACAMLSSVLALVFKENQTPAYIGFSIGTGVLIMAWLQWIALLICGTILLVAIINNLGDILPS